MLKRVYGVIAPDLYYRELPNNKFGYDEVELATAMMYNLDFERTMEEDTKATLDYLKSRSFVDPDKIDVTGFCFGGSITFYLDHSKQLFKQERLQEETILLGLR